MSSDEAGKQMEDMKRELINIILKGNKKEMEAFFEELKNEKPEKLRELITSNTRDAAPSFWLYSREMIVENTYTLFQVLAEIRPELLDEELLKRFVEGLKSDDYWVRMVTAENLERVLEVFERVNPRIREKYKRVFSEWVLRGFVEGLKSDNYWVRKATVENIERVLGVFERVNPEAFTKEVLRGVLGGLMIDDWYVRRVASENLGKVLETFERVNPGIKEKYGEIFREEALKGFVEGLKSGDDSVREVTAENLERVLEVFERVNPRIREKYKRVFSERVLRGFVEGLKSGDSWVRRVTGKNLEKVLGIFERVNPGIKEKYGEIFEKGVLKEFMEGLKSGSPYLVEETLRSKEKVFRVFERVNPKVTKKVNVKKGGSGLYLVGEEHQGSIYSMRLTGFYSNRDLIARFFSKKTRHLTETEDHGINLITNIPVINTKHLRKIIKGELYKDPSLVTKLSEMAHAPTQINMFKGVYPSAPAAHRGRIPEFGNIHQVIEDKIVKSYVFGVGFRDFPDSITHKYHKYNLGLLVHNVFNKNGKYMGTKAFLINLSNRKIKRGLTNEELMFLSYLLEHENLNTIFFRKVSESKSPKDAVKFFHTNNAFIKYAREHYEHLDIKKLERLTRKVKGYRIGKDEWENVKKKLEGRGWAVTTKDFVSVFIPKEKKVKALHWRHLNVKNTFEAMSQLPEYITGEAISLIKRRGKIVGVRIEYKDGKIKRKEVLDTSEIRRILEGVKETTPDVERVIAEGSHGFWLHGVASGRLTDDHTDKGVLITDKYPTEETLKKVSALIMPNLSRTSHSAILAKQLGIPVLANKEVYEKLRRYIGKSVVVEATMDGWKVYIPRAEEVLEELGKGKTNFQVEEMVRSGTPLVIERPEDIKKLDKVKRAVVFIPDHRKEFMTLLTSEKVRAVVSSRGGKHTVLHRNALRLGKLSVHGANIDWDKIREVERKKKSVIVSVGKGSNTARIMAKTRKRRIR